MGNYTYLSANTHLKQDKLKALGYLMSGFTGNIVVPTNYNGENSDRREFECFPGFNIHYEINKDNEIVLRSSAKWTSYEEASSFKFSAFKTIERLANYLGGCDVTILTEEGITPHPKAVDGVYEYTTPTNENVSLDEDMLSEQVKTYEPCQINAQLFYNHNKNRSDILEPYVANRIIMRNFEDAVKTPHQLANVTAFLCYRNKEDIDFTEEDVNQYLSRDNSTISLFVGEVTVNSQMRCKGMKDFFENIGRKDLAKVVEEREEFFLRKQEFLNRECDVERLLTLGSRPQIKRWSSKKGESYYLFNENTVSTITLYDTSDFYHFEENLEAKKYPFGAETISVTIFQSGVCDFLYKNNHTLDGDFCKNKSNSFFQLLDNIQHPAFLNQILDSIDECKDKLNNPYNNYITDSELQMLRNKLPIMERNLQSKRNEVSKII